MLLGLSPLGLLPLGLSNAWTLASFGSQVFRSQVVGLVAGRVVVVGSRQLGSLGFGQSISGSPVLGLPSFLEGVFLSSVSLSLHAFWSLVS